MALVVKDRVQESSTTTGTGTLTLGGALTGFQSFSSAIGNGNTTYYAITLNGEWEVGLGTVGSGTLTRDTVLESSNSGSLVNFSAGTKNVFCTYPAEKSLYLDASGNVGIGTSSPSEKLQVAGNLLLDNGNADGAQLSLASNGYSNWNLDNYSGRFRAYYNATEYFTITNSGNMRIGSSDTSLGSINTINTFGFKNRIINGAMMIDQRNAGASVTPAAVSYTLDRWKADFSVASKYSIQQNAGSVTPPAGYKNYLGVTSSSAYSVGASDYFYVWQAIEGLNCADLGWGAAGASTVTLSFWVRSSLTGTFGGTIQNYASNRSYPFSYTISVANTWEQKTVTIAGDTTGTWLTTNGIGMYVGFGLGVGSTYSGTAGSWAAANYVSATGATSVVGTNGATFYITGVQLEKGSQATSFDYRPYGTELQLCQRYYYKTIPSTSNPLTDGAWAYQATGAYGITKFPVTLRANPSALEQSGTAADYAVYIGGAATNCSAIPSYVFSSVDRAMTTFTVASGLTTGQGGYARPTGANAYLAWSAEL